MNNRDPYKSGYWGIANYIYFAQIMGRICVDVWVEQSINSPRGLTLTMAIVIAFTFT